MRSQMIVNDGLQSAKQRHACLMKRNLFMKKLYFRFVFCLFCVFSSLLFCGCDADSSSTYDPSLPFSPEIGTPEICIREYLRSLKNNSDAYQLYLVRSPVEGETDYEVYKKMFDNQFYLQKFAENADEEMLFDTSYMLRKILYELDGSWEIIREYRLYAENGHDIACAQVLISTEVAHTTLTFVMLQERDETDWIICNVRVD